MICKYCKNEIADNSRFCGFCGHRLDVSEKQNETVNQETQNTDSQTVYSNVSFDSDYSQEQKTANNSDSTNYSNVSFDNVSQQTNSKVNKPKRNISFHLSDGAKKVISVILVIIMFLSIISAYLTLAMRYFISPDSVHRGIENDTFKESVVEDKEGNTISFSKEVLNLMGEHFSDDLGITEEKLKDFFSEYDVEKSFANLYYKYIMQFVDINKTGSLSSEDFTAIFKDNPEEVKECLGVEFDEHDYDLMNEGFEYGFSGNISTTDVIAYKYPIQFTNTLFSEYTLWFSISLLALSICLYQLVNYIRISKLLKLLYKTTIAAAVAMSLLWAFYKFIQHSIIADCLMTAFIITVIVAFIPIGVMRLRFMFSRAEKAKEKDDKKFREECEKVFGKDEDGEVENEQQT